MKENKLQVKNIYEKKGILKFPDNYPEVYPKFFFDKINPNKNY